MNRFVVNVSEYPIVAVIYPERPSYEEARELFAFYADLARSGGRAAYTIDMRRFDPIAADPRTRRQIVELFKEHEPLLRQSTICEARIVPGVVARGIVTAFDWMTGSKWPCTNVRNAADAVAWVREHLAADGRPGKEPAPSFHDFVTTPEGVVRFAA